ncbi:MAG: hypothetical protein ACLQKK_00225 [Rhodomicrobium sp.]
MSTRASGSIRPPTPETIEAYREAVRAYRTSYRPMKRGGGQDELWTPKTAAATAVRRLRPGLSESEANALAQDAIDWAEQSHNECFWDL